MEILFISLMVDQTEKINVHLFNHTGPQLNAHLFDQTQPMLNSFLNKVFNKFIFKSNKLEQ